MSVEKITVVRYRCVCELPDCPGRDPKTGKPRPWLSRDDAIPKRCSWCKMRNWNGHADKRLKQDGANWVRVRQCTVCGGTEFAEGHDGLPVCVRCSSAPLTAGPKKQPAAAAPARPEHAPGCTCLTCKLEHEPHGKPKRPKRAAIELPKPKKVRAIE